MSTVLDTPIVSGLADADMQAVPAALARAAQSARELAARTGTPLVVARDGKLVEAEIPLGLAETGKHGTPVH
jgi:adenine/guanine phosphoribosyltransferase-like PRPP-binding protein